MLRQLLVLALTLSLCQAHFVQLRIQEPEELPGFHQHVFIGDGSQQVLSSMHSPINPMPSDGQSVYSGMQNTPHGDWDSWMDAQFNVLQAMNQAVLGRRGGCGGHLLRESFGPVLIRGVPTLTTPSAVMQRLASARFGNDLLKALIEAQVQADSKEAESAAISDQDEDAELPEMPEAVDVMLTGGDEGAPAEVVFNDDDAEEGAEGLAWASGERLLSQADEDEEAEAEADAIEVPEAEWASFLPTWLTAPEDQDLADDPTPAAINWSLTNEDGSTNWGLVVFVVQATACASVWVGLLATLGYYRCARRGRGSRCRLTATADSHLMTPLMYEPFSKADPTAQLYKDLYQVEDAKLHADDRQYVAIQYQPLEGPQ